MIRKYIVVLCICSLLFVVACSKQIEPVSKVSDEINSEEIDIQDGLGELDDLDSLDAELEADLAELDDLNLK